MQQHSRVPSIVAIEQAMLPQQPDNVKLQLISVCAKVRYYLLRSSSNSKLQPT